MNSKLPECLGTYRAGQSAAERDCFTCPLLSQCATSSTRAAEQTEQVTQAKSAIPSILRHCAATFEERSKVYGDNYKRFGHIMHAMFPEGIELKSPDDWNRFGVFVQIISKITRYAENLHCGGHKDSAHDAAVYSAMLEELTK